jgi:hypothetical protein
MRISDEALDEFIKIYKKEFRRRSLAKRRERWPLICSGSMTFSQGNCQASTQQHHVLRSTTTLRRRTIIIALDAELLFELLDVIDDT